MTQPSVANGERRDHSAGSRAALLLVAAGVAVTLVGALPIAAGLLAAPSLAVICRPLHRRLATHVGAHGAAVVVLLIVWIVLVVPSVWLAKMAIQQVPDAVKSLHHGADLLRAMPGPLASVNADTVVARIGAKSVGWISAAVGPAAGSIAHAIADLSIALLGAYFLIVSDDAAWRAVRRWLPFSPAGSDELRDTFTDATRGTLLGTIASAVLQGASIGVGFRLIGSSAPAFWGAVGGFATLIPVVGNAVVWVPAVIASLLHREYGAALMMIAFGKLVPAILNQVVRVSISRRVGNMHPMITLLGALIGVRLVGAVGVLIGPAFVQCSIALIHLYEREYGLPWATAKVE